MLHNAPTYIRFVVTLLLAVSFTLIGCRIWKKKYGEGEKRVNGYYVVSVLLLVWAIADFCHYAATGRELMSQYSGGVVLGVVQNTLFQGIIKLLLSAAIFLVGRIRGRNTPCAALTAVTAMLALGMLVSWGVGMACLTSVTAEYAAERYLNGYCDFASTIAARSLEPWLGKGLGAVHENYDANLLWEAVDSGGEADLFHGAASAIGEGDGFLGRPDSGKTYSATAVFDAEGTLQACSWEDFFYFEYLTEEQWQGREERSGNCARASFVREWLTEEGRKIVSDSSLTFEVAAMRFTGAFDGTEFTPCKIEYIDRDAFQSALHARGSGQYTVSGIVQDCGLVWNTMYEDTSAAAPQGEQVAFYSDWFDVCCNQSSPTFSYKGAAYENAAALAASLGPEMAAGVQQLVSREGLDLLIPSVSYCHSFGGETYYDPYYYGTEAYAEEAPVLHFYTVSVVYCSPWRTAFGELRSIYLFTFLLAAALVLTVRSVIKRHLIQPVQAVGSALMSGEVQIPLYPEPSGAWYESRQLQEGLSKCADRLRMQRNEITRLNTALEYAQKAEEERRQLTSHVAHELKTPLAVLHSYAEGLREHIAEDKRDRYLEVILAETERMDALVLEMLDLSRLEAGKVKLARDTFSLTELAQSVFERLEMAAQAKALQVTWEVPGDCVITADQARIEQVVENFAVNAVKYTPAGGRIRVRLSTSARATRFSVENDCEPLSQEALAHVWDSFYRGDQARDRGGTGLGLAIARSIIHLHGGKCEARATKNGVEFSFVL